MQLSVQKLHYPKVIKLLLHYALHKHKEKYDD
jgi:hypothetical protein